MGTDTYPYTQIYQIGQGVWKVRDKDGNEYLAKKRIVKELSSANLSDWLILRRLECDQIV